MSSVWAAEKIKVMAELAPPFLNADGSGYSISLLREIEQEVGIEFSVQVVSSFDRAWRSVLNGDAEIVLHIAKGKENPEFYDTMIESKWFFPVHPTVYFIDPQKRELFLKATSGPIDEVLRVGLPMGNVHYGVGSLGLPSGTFLQAPMGSLVQQLDHNRIDIIWCMKLTVDKALKEHNIRGVSSMRYPVDTTIRLGAGYRDTPRGRDIRAKIDKAIGRLNLQEMFPLIYQ
ncbi:MAG: hypothetical protein V7776_11545 [Halopseudomonas aestusnigri]